MPADATGPHDRGAGPLTQRRVSRAAALRADGITQPGSKIHLVTDRNARKGIEPSTQRGHHRWVVERTVSWLAGCRRLHGRYERKP